MAIPQSAKNNSVDACPSIDNISLSDSYIQVRKIYIKISLIIYLNRKVNLIGHLKLKVLFWLHFSMAMSLHKLLEVNKILSNNSFVFINI